MTKVYEFQEKANELWDEGKYESALRYLAKAIEKINDALPSIIFNFFFF